MNTPPLFARTPLQLAFTALRGDLMSEEGPKISTMRNYRFAILPYSPDEEFRLREQVGRLSADLIAHGWSVLSISLQQLFMERLRRMGDETFTAIVERERATSRRSPERALSFLRDKLAAELEGPDGVAADVAAVIEDFARRHPDRLERTVVLVGRAGALYPFYRTSALLKHIDGRTRNVPVVLLYPGTRDADGGLSFMGILPSDRDYRPRTYP